MSTCLVRFWLIGLSAIWMQAWLSSITVIGSCMDIPIVSMVWYAHNNSLSPCVIVTYSWTGDPTPPYELNVHLWKKNNWVLILNDVNNMCYSGNPIIFIINNTKIDIFRCFIARWPTLPMHDRSSMSSTYNFIGSRLRVIPGNPIRNLYFLHPRGEFWLWLLVWFVGLVRWLVVGWLVG